MSETCATCRYWEGQASMGARVCRLTRTRRLSDRAEYDDYAIVPLSLARAWSEGIEGSVLRTEPGFGCTQYRPRSGVEESE